LDEELNSLRSLLYAPEPSTRLDDPAEPIDKTSSAPAAPISSTADEKDKEYDHFVRELAFEMRAKPKDRTKTEEELALEEKEALEKAEKERLRRMQGLEASEDEDDSGKRKKRPRGGDDLDDDFMEEDAAWGGLGAGLGDQEAMDEDEDEDEDDDEEQDAEDEEEEEDDNDEEEVESVFSGGEEEGEEGSEEALVKTNGVTRKKTTIDSREKELPYTFPCPESHEEFLEIIDNIDDTDIPTVIKRIRTLHHPSLAQDNKFKLQVCPPRCLSAACY
jgi:nucleolar protein 14